MVLSSVLSILSVICRLPSANVHKQVRLGGPVHRLSTADSEDSVTYVAGRSQVGRSRKSANLVASLLLVAMPGAPSSVLVTTSKALVTSSDALVPSSVLAPSSDARSP